MSNQLKQLRTWFSALGGSMPTPSPENRGMVGIKRLVTGADDAYIGLRNASNAMTWERVITETLGGTLYVPVGHDSDEVFKQSFVVPGGTTMTEQGMTITYNHDAIANTDGADGPWLQTTSAAVDPSHARVITAYTQVRLDWNPDVEFRVKTPNSLTDTRWFVGLFSAAPDASSPTVHGLGFRYRDSDGFRMFYNNNDGTGVSWVTGVTLATDELRVLRITFDGTTAKFFIEGVLTYTLASANTKFPSVTAPLGLVVQVTTLAAVLKSCKVARMSLRHEG